MIGLYSLILRVALIGCLLLSLNALILTFDQIQTFKRIFSFMQQKATQHGIKIITFFFISFRHKHLRWLRIFFYSIFYFSLEYLTIETSKIYILEEDSIDDFALGTIHKLRGQEDIHTWLEKCRFLSTFIVKNLPMHIHT